MYGFQYNLLKRFFSDVAMNELSTESLKQYLIDDSGHLKPFSLGHRIRFIKSIFKLALVEWHISLILAVKLIEIQLDKILLNILTKYEIDYILEICLNP